MGDKSFKGATLTDINPNAFLPYQKFIIADMTFTAKKTANLGDLGFSIYSSYNHGSSSMWNGLWDTQAAAAQQVGAYIEGKIPLTTGSTQKLSTIMLIPQNVISAPDPIYLQITPNLADDRFFAETIKIDASQYVR